MEPRNRNLCSIIRLTSLIERARNPDMGRKMTRLETGANFSDGARGLWAVAESISVPGVAAALRVTDRTVRDWLYGLKRPSMEHAVLIQNQFGIRVPRWAEPSKVLFQTPAARVRKGKSDGV